MIEPSVSRTARRISRRSRSVLPNHHRELLVLKPFLRRWSIRLTASTRTVGVPSISRPHEPPRRRSSATTRLIASSVSAARSLPEREVEPNHRIWTAFEIRGDDGEVERRHLPELALAGEPEPDEDARAHQERPDDHPPMPPSPSRTCRSSCAPIVREGYEHLGTPAHPRRHPARLDIESSPRCNLGE